VKLVQLFGFIIKKFVAMHGDMNVKLILSLHIVHISILKFLFLSDFPKKMLSRFLIYPQACYMPVLLNYFFLVPVCNMTLFYSKRPWNPA